MVKKSIIFLICCISVASLQAFEVDDKLVSSRTITKPNGSIVYEGQIYTVTRHTPGGSPVLNTSPQFIIGPNQLPYFELATDYTKYQQIVESLAMCTGATLLIVFVKGFSNPFSF